MGSSLPCLSKSFKELPDADNFILPGQLGSKLLLENSVLPLEWYLIHGIHRLDVYFSCKKHAWSRAGLKSSIWERCKVPASAEQTPETGAESRTLERCGGFRGFKAPFFTCMQAICFVLELCGQGSTNSLCQETHATKSRMSIFVYHLVFVIVGT